MNNILKNQHNSYRNFTLKGITSIIIGVYFLLSAYLIKYILDGFLIDNSPMGFMSAQIIEILVFSIVFLIVIFSSLSLFFAGRRKARKNNYNLWNKETKTTFWKYFAGIVLLFLSFLYLTNKGLINYAAPVFFILYAILLFILKEPKQKNILILIILNILLGFLTILIPSYWHSSLSILGIAHITYGLAYSK